jgi:pimeloyl-ACP methyl ester carboxylesterase
MKRWDFKREDSTFKHGYADVNGVGLHYVTSGKGKLILFAHGFPSFWYMWKEQLIEFGNEYQAMAVDMRGYNLSSKPTGIDQYKIDILIEDLRALVDSLGHNKCILVAHDWGGVVAWPFAIRYPDYLEKLIIINAPHLAIFARLLSQDPDQQRASQYIRMFRTPEAEQILSNNNYEALLNAIQTEDTHYSDEDREMYIRAWSQAGALTGGLNYYRAAPFEPPALGEKSGPSEKDMLKSLNFKTLDVKVPTLVIWGEKDTALLTANLEGLEDYVPDLIIKRIPDGSHWVVNEKSDLVTRYIREFIQ